MVDLQNFSKNMPLSYSAHQGPFALVVVTGAGRLGDMVTLVDWTAAVCESASCRRVLLDVLSAEIELEDDEAAQLGQHAARTLLHVERVAIATRESARCAVAEQVALSAGLGLRSFTDLKKATDWLSD